MADPPSEGELEQFEGRLLLRFDGFVHNRGPGELEFRGSQPAFPNMQRVVQSVGGIPVQRNATIKFETNDDHNHFHLMEIARYSLWNAFRSAEVAPAMKVGFCLLDSEPVEADEDEFPTYLNESFCEADNRGATSVLMGVSPGWRDVYDRGLAFQWIDVSDVQPGIYWLRSEIDPDGFVRETTETNSAPFGAEASVIPGYVAQPVSQELTAGRPATVTLRANGFGDARRVQYRVDVPPTCGDLDRPTGAWSSDATVTYTPRPGCTRSDGFQYSARDSTSVFPRSPARAAALLAATAPGPAARSRSWIHPATRSLRGNLWSPRQAGHGPQRPALRHRGQRVAGAYLERGRRDRRQLARWNHQLHWALQGTEDRPPRPVRADRGSQRLGGQRLGPHRDRQASRPEAGHQPQAARGPAGTPGPRAHQAHPHGAGGGEGQARARDRGQLPQDARARTSLIRVPRAREAGRAAHQAEGCGHDDGREAHAEQANPERPPSQELALALPPLSRQGRQPVLTAQLGAWRQSRASGTRRGMMLASSIPSRP